MTDELLRAAARQLRVVRGGERQIDGEDAPSPGQVADVDVSTMRPHGLPGNRESEAESGPVATAPLAERLKRVTFAFGDSTAFIFNVDEEVRLVVGRCA
jgi:hypothetical protein